MYIIIHLGIIYISTITILTFCYECELVNSKRLFYLPGRLVSICPRGVYLANPNINPSGTMGDQTIQKHKQTTVYLCPGKEKATLEMTYILEKALSAFKCTLIK